LTRGVLQQNLNSNEWPRAAATAAIWIAIGFALGFGLFRMNFSGGGAVLLPLLAVLLLAGGVIATGIVWQAKPGKSGAEQNR
jgi:Flp pilus assembly protein protease CpaA